MPDDDQGWIMLHRKIWDNPHSSDPEWLSVWVYLLCRACHKPYDVIWKGDRITLQPGQMITGRKAISKATGVGESKVFRILTKLDKAGKIEQQTSNASTLLSITNWGEYQKPNNQRTTDEQPVNTNNNVKKVKNENNKNKEARAKPALVVLPDHLNTPKATETWIAYADHRKAKRAKLTPKAQELILAKFKTATPTDFITAIETSIEKGWTGIFPESGNGNRQNNNQIDFYEDIESSKDRLAAY